MRYIEKGEEPEWMAEWKLARKAAGQLLAYDDFDRKRELNERLREEQHALCCYCQQRLSHYQGEKEGGSHNEHLIPERGAQGDFSKQMDYGNLYACCIDSKGMKKREKAKRHCGEAKEDRRIRGFIQERDCSRYFRYNVLGEIIPNGAYDRWEEYLVHRQELEADVRDATDAIEVLNLNCHFLVEDRKGDLIRLLRILNGMSKEEVERKVEEFGQEKQFQRYLDMLLYFMRKKQ